VDRLARGLIDQGVEAGDIDPVLAKMNQLSQAQDGQGKATELHDAAIAALMDLEYKLRNQLRGADNPPLLISEPTELPDDYKEMITDYFRKLSH
jgi:hypothetical protein